MGQVREALEPFGREAPREIPVACGACERVQPRDVLDAAGKRGLDEETDIAFEMRRIGAKRGLEDLGERSVRDAVAEVLVRGAPRGLS